MSAFVVGKGREGSGISSTAALILWPSPLEFSFETIDVLFPHSAYHSHYKFKQEDCGPMDLRRRILRLKRWTQVLRELSIVLQKSLNLIASYGGFESLSGLGAIRS